MECREVEERLPRFVDGTLDAGMAESVTAHLAHCRVCAALCTAHRLVAAGLSSAQRVPAPPGFEARLFAAIAREEKARLLATAWRQQAALVAAVLAGAASLYVGLVRWWLWQGAPVLTEVFAGAVPSQYRNGAWLGLGYRSVDEQFTRALHAVLDSLVQPAPLPGTSVALSPLCWVGLVFGLAAWLWYSLPPVLSPPGGLADRGAPGVRRG